MIALDYETLALHNDLSDDDKNLPPMIFRGNFLDVDERKDAIDAISEYMASFEDDESKSVFVSPVLNVCTDYVRMLSNGYNMVTDYTRQLLA